MHLISSAREAQLSFLGVAGRHAVRSEWLMADLGGGSLELVVGHGRTPGSAVSLPIGSGVLAQKYLSDPPTPEERAALRKEALRLLVGAPESAPTRLVVTGGTAVHLRSVVARSAPSQLTTEMLLKAGRELDSAPVAHLAKKLGVEESRIRAMRGGVEVLLLLLDWCGLARLHVSLEGVRDGMILAYLERGEDWWR
jgi:exopolyphosphatase/guanosine-5'-triphosphate,3'-diphosphate pyrophosphatase